MVPSKSSSPRQAEERNTPKVNGGITGIVARLQGQRKIAPEDRRERSLPVVGKMFFPLLRGCRTGYQTEVLERTQPLQSDSQV